MRVIVVCIVGLLLFYAQASTFPLSSLRPGLKGYGLTAGPGNVIERFDVEVLGLQDDLGLGFPLVLIYASGEVIEASGGVAAGMSGSPIYITDQEEGLLGAIGYVFPNSDHQLALVTPIEVMRKTFMAKTPYTPFGGAHFASLGQPIPVRTPLLFSGLTKRASQRLEGLFASSKINPLPVQLSDAIGFDEEAYSLEPGSAVSVQLLRGDINIAAVGTVTLIEDKEVLAFGHPLLGGGEVSFALAPAFISYIVASDIVPFKLATNGQRLLGSIVQDRPAALAGRLEEVPTFFPVDLTLVSEKGTVTKRFEVTNDERYYGPLLASATLQVFDEIVQKVGAGTADLAWEITLKDQSVVRVLEQVTDPDDIAAKTAELAAAPLAILADNIFKAPDVAKVSINLTHEDNERYADIVEVVSSHEVVQAGQTIVAHVRLQPFRGDPQLKTLSITIPEEAEGPLELVFRGGIEQSEDEAGEPILSFGELLVSLKDQVQASELIVETFVEDEKIQLNRLSLPFIVQGKKTITVEFDVADGSASPVPDKDESEEPELEPEDLLPKPPFEPSGGR